jgi:gas vesicle protein
MLEQQGLFKRHFVGRDGFIWWIGQIAPEKEWKGNLTGRTVTSTNQTPGFGERYKVRIMGYHTDNLKELPDKDLPWAHVMYPTTAGGGGGASWQSANLTQGTFVFGFFLDGEDAQNPIIMGAIGHNNYNQILKGLPASGFKPFNGFDEAPVPVFAQKSNPSTGVVAPLTGISTAAAISGSTFPTSTSYSIANVTIQSPTGGQIKSLDGSLKREDGKLVAQLATSTDCKSKLSQISKEIQNSINEIEKIKKSIYKFQFDVAKKTAEIQKDIDEWIAKKSAKIMELIKSVLNDIEKSVKRGINSAAKKLYNLVFPNEQPALEKATRSAHDIFACLWRKIIASLISVVADFLRGAALKVINTANCLVDNFLGSILSQIASLINSVIGQAFGAFNSIVGGAVSIVGDALDLIKDLLSFLSCDDDPECTEVDEWSMWLGAANGVSGSIQGLIDKVSSYPGQVSDTLNADNFNFDLDLNNMFDVSGCFTGPVACGPPLAQFFGGGSGAAVNLIVSGQGEVLGGEVVNAGINYLVGNTFGKVYDQCGKGDGAVIRPVIGTVVVGETTTDPSGTLPDGTVTTGIIGIEVIQGGTGYLPSPDGSLGGSGRTWAENNETIVQHENGDYEIPIPPGNRVCVVAGDLVTIPAGTRVVTEPNSDSGGGEEILGGVPYVMKRDGCLTTPEINYESLRGLAPTLSTGAYPAVLYLCDVIIENSGVNYTSNDRVVIEPSNGAEAVATLNRFGRVTGIKIIKGGEGFTELPTITIESATGYNAILLPRLCIDRIGEDVDKPVTGDLVTVIDCVGKV